MSHTITIRLDPELAAWLEQTAKRTGVSQGQIVRDQLQRARSEKAERRFMRLAGCVDGPRNLSSRKGFSKG
jgi:predicted transcriptional regulator